MRIAQGGVLLVLAAGLCTLGYAQIQHDFPPSYVFGTYWGGSGDDAITKIAVAADGSIYVLGYTTSSDFPVSSNAFQKPNNSGLKEIFITKLSSDGRQVLYSTVLAATYEAWPGGIAVNQSGEVYVTGGADDVQNNFPTTPGAYQTTTSGNHGTVCFISKIDASGSKLLFSTLLGGRAPLVGESCNGIGLDAQGNVFVAGTTGSNDFPVTADAIQSSLGDSSNTFVSKFDGTLSHLLFSTYLGSSGQYSHDNCFGMSVTEDGIVYIAGTTISTNFPVTQAAFQSQPGNAARDYTGFVSVIDTSQPKLLYSSYLGGAYTDSVYAIALAADGTFFVTGEAQSPNFPVTPGAFQTTFGSSYNLLYNDAFVTHFDPKGYGPSSVLYSTFVGYGGDGEALVADQNGSVLLTGTGGHGFTTSDAFQLDPREAYIVALHPAGSSLTYGTYFGASSTSGYLTRAIALDRSGNIYYGGDTYMPDFPVTQGVVQPACGDHQNCVSGHSDGTLGKFATQYADLQIGMAVESTSININEPFRWHIIVDNKGPSVANNVIVADSLPSTFQQISIDPRQVTCSGSASLTCNLGTLGVGQSETVNFSAIPAATGFAANVAAVSSATYDPDESNNAASIQMSVLGPADFSVSAAPQTQTIGAGGTATFQITSNPQNGFKQTINLACSGLPTGAKCQFSPASLNPAAGLANSTLSISFPSNTARLTQSPRYPYSAAILLLPLLGLYRRKSLLSVLSLMILFAGCGGSLQTQNTPPAERFQSQQILVTATSGTLRHSMNLTVVAEQ